MSANGSAGDLFNELAGCGLATLSGRSATDHPHSERYEPSPQDAIRRDIVHYSPGNRPLCGDESPHAVYTDEPHQVAGCEDCLELVADDLQDPDTRYGGYCLHCHREITGHRQRRVAACGPAPMPALRAARLVMARPPAVQ